MQSGSDGAATLKEIARHVEPRDPDNVEARAARFYWSHLFTEFTRDDPGFQDVGPLATYHGEIGREATAVAEMLSHARPAYHREIGREATAPEHEPAADV